ncbi:MAG: hypothetical protein D6679_12095 [Candidatus Hydrogenedentota bacterium]|nr:MAG: hypothetical protein D6679_12095 [Candidatus Hydrogenedentota bacterium]
MVEAVAYVAGRIGLLLAHANIDVLLPENPLAGEIDDVTSAGPTEPPGVVRESPARLWCQKRHQCYPFDLLPLLSALRAQRQTRIFWRFLLAASITTATIAHFSRLAFLFHAGRRRFHAFPVAFVFR